jgi:lipid-binding SYLF domain-containing protein
MKYLKHPSLLTLLAAAFGAILVFTPQAHGASAREINRKSRAALQNLYDSTPGARSLGDSATAVLVFPDIVKAGFIFGAQFGEGTLFSHGKTLGYYSTSAASYGLQAGVQKFGYALFFMTEGDLAYLRKSEGWEIGVGPSIVIVDQGMAKNLTSTTLRKGVYAFVFAQKGLMAGIGLQGTKIIRIHP